MADSYKQLVQEAKRDYHDLKDYPETVQRMHNGNIETVECPRWYEIDLPEGATEELNLWNYWQGVGVDRPTLMLVGQDWGKIDSSSPCIENIRAIATNPGTETQYLSGCDMGNLEFDTDDNLIKIFDECLGRRLDKERFGDLYFTNLCLGYRKDGTNGYWRQSWLTRDANRYFKRLVKIKQPSAIVCLGRATSETAYKALTGDTLQMHDGFYGYIENQGTGLELADFNGIKFFVVPHPGGMGTANRIHSRGGDKSAIDDWAFLKTVF